MDGRNDPAAAVGAPLRHVLVVDDDPGIRTLLVRILRTHGYLATAATDGAEMRRALASQPIDLVLLDVMLPGESGIELCREIREERSVPVIMVSARGGERDRVLGLETGADDYIAKPFSRAELLARVRAVLRRGQLIAPEARPPDVMLFAGWRYDLRRRELLSPEGAQVELSDAEQDLLVSLLQNPGRTIGRERLLELSRVRLARGSDRSVDVLVSRLRRKIGDSDRPDPLIRTIRGVGYMFTAEVSAG